MLVAKRFDYFPRPVRQIRSEVDRNASSGAIVAPHIALYYPSAVYFFDAKKNTALAEALETGLTNAMADGSFQKLFHEYSDATVSRAQFEGRTVFKLNNPYLPPETPLHKRQLWEIPGGEVAKSLPVKAR